MTEKEKKQAGLLYYELRDEVIAKELLSCKETLYEYNQLRPSQLKEKEKIIRKLFGKTSDHFFILGPFSCDLGYNIEIGDHFFSNQNCIILDAAKVTFGDNVLIGPNCCFTTSGHPLDVEQRVEGLEFAFPITVGNNVWFGANSIVLPGVTIGNDTVIGAGSVVTKNIPEGVVAVGNPCKVLRKITEQDKEKYHRD
jgi:Acetyltransferase (isoleucine patch superfamily)